METGPPAGFAGGGGRWGYAAVRKLDNAGAVDAGAGGLRRISARSPRRGGDALNYPDLDNALATDYADL
jgi:hypothetical protein